MDTPKSETSGGDVGRSSQPACSTRFSLQKMDRTGAFGDGYHAQYKLIHRTPGADGTTLEEYLGLESRDGGFEAMLDLTGCKADTADAALEKMSTWLKRLAKVIDDRKGESLPLS